MIEQDWGDGWTTELVGHVVRLWDGDQLRGVHAFDVEPVTVLVVDKDAWTVEVQLPL